MTDCIFCKIATKKISASIIYENADVVAFLDIKPIAAGHTIVIPKQHYDRFSELPIEIAQMLGGTLRVLAPMIAHHVGAGGFNLGINNGAVAGEVVHHAHWHIIPRFEDDGLQHWQGHTVPTQALTQLAETLQEKFSKL